jgi:DsbC/DsbD-like thiol-disulfide interchange protein
MKKLTLLIAVLFFAISGAVAQIHDPVKFTVASKKLNSKEAVIFIKATIQDGWHIYSQNIAENVPNPTVFTFTPSKDYTLNGKTAEPKPAMKYEEVFKMNVGYFKKEVIFQQKVKLNKGTTTVKGNVEYQACDKTQCLPPTDYAFSVVIK